MMGGNHVHQLVGFCGNEVFLEEEFDGIRQGLKDAVGSDAHGAEAALKMAGPVYALRKSG